MSDHLSVRIDEEQKKMLAELGRRLGYPDTSKFMNAVIEGLTERYDGEEWESGLVHLDGDKISDRADRTAEPSDIYAFPIVAPARFWRYLRRDRDEDER
jgi:hypothetical protein